MGKKTSTTTSQVQIPPEVMARYNAVNTRAEEVASKPFQKYGTEASDFVAQINEQQRAGINNVNAAAGSYQPYIDAATGATVAGMDEANAAELDISKYMSPYVQNVADTTGAMLSQENARAQSGNLGTAISSGAFGGDRAGIAAANLSQQQNLAYGKTMADIYNQGYTQAVGTAQQQQGVNLAADQANLARLTEGGAQLAGLGTTAQQAGLAGAEAQINAGTLEQQTEQAGKTALVNQFMQEQGYPFQVAQFLANIATGTGALSGSTTATTQPAPFFSDRRLKHDVKRIGKTDDGLPIYSFKYKGDEKEQTHVGFMADEVEKVKPEAVGVHPTGYKTVDYAKATEKNSMGGGVAPQRAGEAFADGGVAGPYGSAVGSQPGGGSYVPQAYLPVGDLMVADPAHLKNAQGSMAQQLASLAALGESAKEIKSTWDWAKDGFKSEAVGEAETARGVSANAYGGAVGAQYLKPQQGGLAPNTEKSYLTDTLASQDKSDKPKLDAAPGAGGGGGSSPAGDIAALAKIGLAIAGIPLPFRNGGAAGYDRGGIADAEIIRGPGARATEEDIIRGPGIRAREEDFIRGQGLAAADARLPDLPTQEDLDRRYRADAARPDMFPSERGDYTPLAMDYGTPIYNTLLGRTNTLVPRPDALEGPQNGVFSTFTPEPYVPVRPEGGVAAGQPYSGVRGDGPEAPPAVVPVPAAGTPPAPAGGLVPAAGTPLSMPPPARSPRPVARPEGLGVAAVEQPVERATTGVAAPQPKMEPIVPFGKQLEFVTYELQKPEYSGYLRNEYATPGQAAIAFDDIYEKSGGQGNKIAAANAEDIYSAAQNGDLSGFPPNVQQAYQHFIDNGMDPIQASGAAGRLMVESYSHMDPNARNTLGGGNGTYGIAQWRGDRMEELANFSGVPLDAITGAPISTPEGRYYASGSGQGLGVSTKGQGEPQQDGLGRAMLTSEKPYGDRNVVGKMFYNTDGTLNKNALLSLATGVGGMLSSPSQFFLPSLGLGLQGFAGTYSGLEQQQADILKSRADTASVATQLMKNSIFQDPMTMQSYVMLENGGTQLFSDWVKSPAGASAGGSEADSLLRSLGEDMARDGKSLDGLDPERVFRAGSTETAVPPQQPQAASASTPGMSVQPLPVESTSFGSFPVEPADQGLIDRNTQTLTNMTPDQRSIALAEAERQRAEAVAASTVATGSFRNLNELSYVMASAAQGDMGPLGKYKSKMDGILDQVAQNFGIQYDGSAATYDALFSKLSSLQADQMTSDTAAAKLFLENRNIFPSITSDPDAAAEIAASMFVDNMSDYEYGQFANDFYAAHGPFKSLDGANQLFAQKSGNLYQTEKKNISTLMRSVSNADMPPAVKNAVKQFFDEANSGVFKTPAEAQEALEAIFSFMPGEHEVSSGLGRYFVR